MKLTRQTTTDFGTTDAFGNVSHGRKHYFIIESAQPAELEAVEEILLAAGCDTDRCPCYEDGFSAGFHIDISDVPDFKAAYKVAKTQIAAHIANKMEAIHDKAIEHDTMVNAGKSLKTMGEYQKREEVAESLRQVLDRQKAYYCAMAETLQLEFNQSDEATQRRTIEAAHAEALDNEALLLALTDSDTLTKTMLVTPSAQIATAIDELANGATVEETRHQLMKQFVLHPYVVKTFAAAALTYKGDDANEYREILSSHLGMAKSLFKTHDDMADWDPEQI